MKSWRVQDVMTLDVVAVGPEASYKEIADILVGRSVSAVPVIDDSRRVLGVVSEGDLLPKLEYSDRVPRHPLVSRRIRAGWRKATGDTAAELMTSPAITIRPDVSVSRAARALESARVKRLPVVDESGVLVGIVSRRDLVRLYARPDEMLRAAIADELLPAFWIEPTTVEVEVHAGVVTLGGQVDRHSTAVILARVVEATPGVVDLVNQLTYEFDDADQVDPHWYRAHPFSARLPYSAAVNRVDRF